MINPLSKPKFIGSRSYKLIVDNAKKAANMNMLSHDRKSWNEEDYDLFCYKLFKLLQESKCIGA